MLTIDKTTNDINVKAYAARLKFERSCTTITFTRNEIELLLDVLSAPGEHFENALLSAFGPDVCEYAQSIREKINL